MAIKIDVSEIKAYKSCKRQWKLSSRNRYHLTPTVSNKALSMGTLFHEAMAQLYLGASYEAVINLVKKEMSSDDVALLAMLKGYYNEVLVNDLERWQILDVEHRFNFPSGIGQGYWYCPSCDCCVEPEEVTFEETHQTCSTEIEWDDSEVVNICGAIDLIVYEPETNQVFGIEHKTCGQFRQEAFLWMDEQPRVYTRALELYLEEAKKQTRVPQSATLGGIYINEVKKLLRYFQYKRVLCTYDEEDTRRFWSTWLSDVLECSEAVKLSDDYTEPSPSYFACQLCAFSTICASHGYRCITKETILNDYGQEFKVRDCDHLDEKLDFGAKLKEGK